MKPDITATTLNHWRDIRNWEMAAALLFSLTVTGRVQGQVTNIIYQDNFARTGVLNGSAPDTVNLPGATWFACNNPGVNAVLMTDGSEVACTNTPNPVNGIFLNGFLPFTPVPGHIYTLSCQMVALSGGAQWLAMGFATSPLTNNYYAAVNCGAGFILLRGNGSGIQTFRSPGGGSVGTYNAAFGTTTNVFTVVLNTATNGTTAINADYGWVYTFYTNGVQVDSYRVPYGNPPIQYVGIGADAATGYFQQFTLTDVLMFPGAPMISEQPNNRTAQVGQRATFWVGVTNDSPPASYQWVTNAPGGPTNAIVGATNATYTTPPLDFSYNGLNYSVRATNVYGATNSALATMTVTAGPPTVYSAVKTASLTNIIVAFSKAVDPVTGLNPANYSLNINGAPSGVSVFSANYGALSNSVILTTTMLNTNAGYFLSVQNVKDLFGNAMSSVANQPVLPSGLVFFVRADSGVVYDGTGAGVVQWLDQTTNGDDASQFFGVPTAGPAYIPSLVRPTTDVFNNLQPALEFGSTIHWLQAPSSPALASMISNTTMYAVVNFTGGSDDLVNKCWGNLPAPFDWDPNPIENVQYGNGFNNAPANGTGNNSVSQNTPYVVASTISLPTSGGTTNFAFYLNGNGNGSGSIRAVTGVPAGIYDGGRPLWIGARWDLVNPRMRGQIAEILLFNTTLSGPDRTNVDNYLGAKYFPIAITQNLPATTTSSNGFSVTYTFTAGQGSVHGFSIQWLENGTNIPGATGSTFTTPLLGPGDNGDTFVAVLTRPDGSTTNSVTNTLTVIPAAPYVVTAGIPIWESTGSTNIIVVFDTAVNPATATVAGNYSLTGASVLSAVMGAEPNKVVLTTTAPLAAWNANPGNYSLQVQNVQNNYGQTIATASTPVGIYPGATVLWLESGTGVFTDPGANTVNEWDDQSGLKDNLYQYAGVAEEPFLTTNANGHGLPTIQFVGTNTQVVGANGYSTYLSSVNNVGNDYPGLEITNDMSAFVVVNFTTLANGTNGEILSKLGAGGTANHQPAPYDYYVANSSQTVFLRGNGTANGSEVSTNGVNTLGFPHVMGVNESGNFVSQFCDAANVGTNFIGGAILDAGQPFQIGQRTDLVNRLNGYMSELILISSGLDSNDITSIQNYLAAKYFIPTGTNSYPAITQEPVSSMNVDQGSTLVVPAAASGNPLSLQWYDTNNIAQAGQTSATLDINNIQNSDSYYLVATNIYGAVTSTVVTVTVYTGLTVSLGPPVVALYAGEPCTLTAQALGTAPIYYQWYQGVSPILNATNASYSTVAVLGTTNTYSCLVTNGYNGYSSTNAGPVSVIGIAQPTNAFSRAVLSDGPVAYWRLNETSGSTVAYDYVGGYNGLYGTNTTNGLPGVPFIGASGELGVAMDNSAPAPYTNGFIITPGVPINTNTVTFLCWAYPFATQTNSAGLIFYRVNGTVAGYQFGNNNSLSYNWNNNSATYNFASSFAVPAGIWSLVAVTITPSNGVVYVLNTAGQNSQVNSVTNASLSLAQAGFAIGADPQNFTLPSRIFNGEMDEAAIFNYTLSASQLQQLYTAATTVPVNPNPTNIVFSVANNVLHLSWPADHLGWQLQAQTNKTSVGISTNWANYNPSTGTTQVAIPINLTNGTVFYRLIYTP